MPLSRNYGHLLFTALLEKNKYFKIKKRLVIHFLLINFLFKQ